MVENDTSPKHQKVSRQALFDVCTIISPRLPITDELKERLRDENHVLEMLLIVNDNWLAGALTHNLQSRTGWDSLDDSFKTYLTEIASMYQVRAEEIKNELLLVVDLIGESVNNLVVLKGAASLFNGVSSPISTRFMNDIDILVDPSSVETAVKLLKEAGFSQDQGDFDIDALGHHHAPPMLRENSQCYVEIHRRIFKSSLDRFLPVDLAIEESVALPLNEEIVVSQLSPTCQVIHNIVHSEISDGAFTDYFLDLRQQVNLVSLILHFKEAIDWQTVEKHFRDNNATAELFHVLYSISTLFNVNTPITRAVDSDIIRHWRSALDLYCRNQGQETRLKSFLRVLSGYSRNSILDLYGDQGSFPLLSGRWKHLKRHIALTFSSGGNKSS